jgi:hypothetical protein
LLEAHKLSWNKGIRCIVTCNKCEDNIFSRLEGDTMECKCSSVKIDQTPTYTRIMGNDDEYSKKYEKPK